MARFTAAVLVVGALLLAPTALALNLVSSSPFSPTQAPRSMEGSQATQFASPSPEQTVSDVQQAANDVLSLLDCRDAVRVEMTAWGGMGGASELREAAFVFPWTITKTLTIQTPRIATVTVTEPALSLLDAPTVRQVQRVVGFDTSFKTITEVTPLAISLEYDSHYISWTELRESTLVTLPIGLPLVATRNAVLERVCDSNAVILNSMPAMSNPGYDYWSVTPVQDGWFDSLLSIDVKLASNQQQTTLPRWGGGYVVSTGDVMKKVQRHLESLDMDAIAAPSLDRGGLEDGLLPDLQLADEDAELQSNAATVASSTAHAATSMVAWVALATMLAGALSIAWRRRQNQ